jgi:hypothetical protein
MFDTKVVEKIKTHILCSVNFFSKIAPFMRKCENKNCRAGQATDDNMAHAHFILDTQGYKQKLTICKTYCFSITTMVVDPVAQSVWRISLQAGQSGIESRWGRDFPPIQTGPEAHPASCKMGTEVFPGGKVRPGRAADHSPPSSAAVME